MRRLKKVLGVVCGTLFSAIIIVNMPQLSKAVESNEIVVNESNFPDKVFRDYILENIDTNKDEILSNDEIKATVDIYMNFVEPLSSLKGIEYFTYLERLSCANNKLTELDISRNTHLNYLYCNNNNLSALDISKNVNLEYLECRNNKIGELKLDSNVELWHLYCCDNNIQEIDVSKNKKLFEFSCSNNAIKKLDVKENSVLNILVCDENQITELDVSGNKTLGYLGCGKNQITELDLSKNTVLQGLYCAYNKITSLQLNKYSRVELDIDFLHGMKADLLNTSNLNIKSTEDGDYIIVTDSTKPATYQYVDFDIDAAGNPISCIIRYIDVNDSPDAVISNCTHLFSDYEYTNPVSGTAVTIYGNGATFSTGSTKVNSKVFTAYTDILASYKYKANKNGAIKASTGKVIAGVTMTDEKPVLTKNKIIDSEAAKIAKATVRNGKVTVTAVGKQKGKVYLWIMDTGDREVYECCPINVKMAPKKLEIQGASGNKLSKFTLPDGEEADVYVAGIVSGNMKTQDCTYTATVSPKYEEDIEVDVTSDINCFTLFATGDENKAIKAFVTFTCNQNGKKIKFPIIIPRIK